MTSRSASLGTIVGIADSPLGRDCSGTVSLTFAVTAVSLIGFAGLATEGGTWYLERRHGQNTADAAAMAGVLALAAGASTGSSAVIGTGKDIGTRNGYTTGVSINNPPISGAFAGNTKAVEAIVTRSPPRLFSALFLGTDPTISERAVALLDNSGGTGCALSLAGSFTFKGNTTVNAPNCAMVSNNTGNTDSISCGNSTTVNVGGLVAAGGITGCSGTISAFQPPSLDPFKAIQSVTMPPIAPSKTSCQNMPSLSGKVSIGSAYSYTTSNQKLFCNGTFGSTKFSGDLQLTTGNSIDFAPGTYIFYDSLISLNGGSVTCSACSIGGDGVTVILTGSDAKNVSLSINGNASVVLNAPAINTFDTAFNGVLFYIDANLNLQSSQAVTLNGGAGTKLTGGMYFPSAAVNYEGNVSANSTCTELVAYSITFTGNSYLDATGCKAAGSPVAEVQSVHLVM